VPPGCFLEDIGARFALNVELLHPLFRIMTVTCCYSYPQRPLACPGTGPTPHAILQIYRDPVKTGNDGRVQSAGKAEAAMPARGANRWPYMTPYRQSAAHRKYGSYPGSIPKRRWRSANLLYAMLLLARRPGPIMDAKEQYGSDTRDGVPAYPRRSGP